MLGMGSLGRLDFPYPGRSSPVMPLIGQTPVAYRPVTHHDDPTVCSIALRGTLRWRDKALHGFLPVCPPDHACRLG
jgi:hypothetical protein